VVQNKAAASVAAALEKLNAAKSGAKRVETFELKEEEAVYDVVDDESYAQLANKRRIEAGEGWLWSVLPAAYSTSRDACMILL
jgi:DNA polymerase alpha subunit A